MELTKLAALPCSCEVVRDSIILQGDVIDVSISLGEDVISSSAGADPGFLKGGGPS